MIYNVLVAEPDNDNWASIVTGVRRYQSEAAIVRVKDGEQAVRHLFQRGLFTEEPETPHLIVLTAELPIMSVETIVERLRQHPRTRAIPVLVIRRADDGDERISHSAVLEIVATERLEKVVAHALTRLHEDSPRDTVKT